MRSFVFAFVLAFLLTGFPAAPADAAGDDGVRKPVVVLLPVINNSSQKHTRYMAEMVDEMLQAKFNADRCWPVYGQGLMDTLRRQGVEDYRALDSAAFLAVMQGLRADYVVRAEILPVVTQQRLHFPDVFLLMKTWTATVPVAIRVTSVASGATVYEATFTEWAKHDGFVGFTDRHYAIRPALAKVLEKFSRETMIPEQG